eukprot:Trichotokara_eunicae@DN7685_c0_g1_i1.p1
MQRAQELYPSEEIVFKLLIGDDLTADLPKWYDYKTLKTLPFLVYARLGKSVEEIIQILDNFEVVDSPCRFYMSSSEARRRLMSPSPPGGNSRLEYAAPLVCPPVIAYIKDQELYKSEDGS